MKAGSWCLARAQSPRDTHLCECPGALGSFGAEELISVNEDFPGDALLGQSTGAVIL